MARKFGNAMVDTLLLVGGGVVGAGLALLFAPQSGKKSRVRIAKFSKTMSRRGEKALKGIADNVTDFADTMGTMGDRVMRRVH